MEKTLTMSHRSRLTVWLLRECMLVLIALLAVNSHSTIAIGKEMSWEKEAQKWKALAKYYHAKYGWIEDQHGWCSMNRSISNFGGYDEPDCFKPDKPWCSIMNTKCSYFEVENYRREMEDWVNCRRQYIEEAKADAGCALFQIKSGIDKAYSGE